MLDRQGEEEGVDADQPKHPVTSPQRAKLFTAIETVGAGVNAAPRGAVERKT